MKRARTVLVVAGLTLSLSACGGTSPAATTSPTTADAPAAPSGTPAPGPHNSADVMFAQMMIEHHNGALEMSDPGVVESAGPQVKALARQISAAQAPEIARMTGWLQGWGEPVESGHDAHSMPGMTMNGKTHEQVMDELSDLEGARFDKAWLTSMIAHHQGAVDMAKTVLEQGSNPEVKTLARHIIESQNSEIAAMKKMLG